MSDEVAYLPVTELVEKFRTGRLSPVDAVRAAYERIEKFEKQLNAFCHVGDERDALDQARASERRWQSGATLGLLDGVPITVKDAVMAKGWPTLRGSKTVDPNQAWPEDAPAVARAREHGAIIIGKTTTPEFGWKAVTDSPLSGISRNPWNIAMTPGGSSGGSAAALAAGIGHAAIGTDAGGSVRIPGSLCGLVAIKATTGRIANYPPSAAGTLGHIGPMTRTAADAALMLDVIGVPDARDWLCLPRPKINYRSRIDEGIRGKRVAFSPTLGYAKLDPSVASLVADAARALEALGAKVEHVDAPFKDPTECFRVHFFAGIAHSLRNLTPEQLALLDPELAATLRKARRVKLGDFMAAADQRAVLGRATRLLHESYDLLLTPTIAVAAFPVGRLSPKGYDRRDWLSWSPFTYPFNLTGQPAATVPCGFTKKGLPVGLQIVGAMFADDLVLRAAQAYQTAHSTLERRPKL